MNTNYHHALLSGMDNADTNILFSTWVVHVSRSLNENWLQELVPLVTSEGAVYDPPPVRNQAFLRSFVVFTTAAIAIVGINDQTT